MILMHTQPANIWVWTKEENLHDQISPEFDNEADALAWRGDVSFEIHREYSMLVSGKRMVIPVDREHAYKIIDVTLKHMKKIDGIAEPEQPLPTAAPKPVSQPVNSNFEIPPPVPKLIVNDPGIPSPAGEK